MVHGDGWEDSVDCHGRGESAGSDQSMSMSMSTSRGSSILMVESRVSCSDLSRRGDLNGFLSSPSSSEVSTGVRAGVRRG